MAFDFKKECKLFYKAANKPEIVELPGVCYLAVEGVEGIDDEPASVALMDGFLEEQGYVNDFSDMRRHHEIYLSDVRKVEVSRWKTIICHPIKKKA